MAARNKLTKVDRVIALALAALWFGMGVGGVVLGLIQDHFILIAPAFFAIWYGIIWFRVAALSRRLSTWREFIAPWRAQ
jgi:hypothetical protein